MEIDIKGTLVPVAVDLIAEAGQYIVVVAGVCVAVYTGVPSSTVAARKQTMRVAEPAAVKAEAAPQAPKALAAPKAQVPAKKPRKPLSPPPDHLKSITQERVLGAFHDFAGPHSTRSLADHLGLNVKDDPGRGKVWRMMLQLESNGLIEKTDKRADGPGAGYLYALTAKGRRSAHGTPAQANGLSHTMHASADSGGDGGNDA